MKETKITIEMTLEEFQNMQELIKDKQHFYELIYTFERVFYTYPLEKLTKNYIGNWNDFFDSIDVSYLRQPFFDIVFRGNGDFKTLKDIKEDFRNDLIELYNKSFSEKKTEDLNLLIKTKKTLKR